MNPIQRRRYQLACSRSRVSGLIPKLVHVSNLQHPEVENFPVSISPTLKSLKISLFLSNNKQKLIRVLRTTHRFDSLFASVTVTVSVFFLFLCHCTVALTHTECVWLPTKSPGKLDQNKFFSSYFYYIGNLDNDTINVGLFSFV